METVGWGVIGCGWVARDHVAPAIRAAGHRLVVACDPDRDAALALGPERLATADLDELLDHPEVEAVHVATPNHTHADVVTAVAKAGLPVLCEKPLAATVSDARRLVDSAGGALAGTAFDQRFHPAHRRIADLVAEGALGTVTAIRIVYGCWLPERWSPDGRPHDNWRVDPTRSGGGALVDLAPHGVDLVGALLGEDLVELTVRTQRRVHPYPVDDGALLAGVTGGGVLFQAHVSFNTADALPRRRLDVVGTAAQLVAVDTLGQSAGGTLTRLDAATGATTAVPFDVDTTPFTAQARAFSTAVRDGGWQWPLARDLRLHELLHTAAERS
ncbi:Gfo/Idh/MocA family oxidoreductase [Micromonospora sp. WMMD1120]|uniref:Gfo/Idh/MocA family protein n=1 Tax=Micromonospora sp. WMMD1120 TaxID=3016106 RepID=UPI0024180711|nr:Gfo/Idh/MocA family oxidoreductase [Micromonospora sp. WMMD1120]MDG4811017.1 Gfo/Idh/MocA family oxidoreductase [Micromonospora sp. WMMD1120]